MVIIETSMVKDVERRLQFSNIEWLDKQTFEKAIESNQEIYPFLLNSKHGKMYIGKQVLTTHTFQKNSTKRRIEDIVEQIGQVEKSLNNEWTINSEANDQDENADFLVLSLKNPNCYYWKWVDGTSLPKHSLVVALDERTSEFLYIGLCHESGTDSRIGPVRANDQKLYIKVRNYTKLLKKFQILCLKPTPASLTTMCRIKIRKACNYCNSNIARLNDNDLLPSCLVSYLRYPSCLTMGQYLLKDEKLSTDDDKYELFIDIDDYLVCANTVSKSKLLLYNKNIDTIWLHPTQTIFFYSKSHQVYLGCLFNHIPNVYEFKLFNNKEHPKFIFDYAKLNSDCKYHLLYNYFNNYDDVYFKYFSN